MLYVMTMRWQPGLNREQRNAALARRAGWKYPSAAREVAEYWLTSEDVAVISVFEADSYAPLMEVQLIWGDMFQIECHPAVTADEGLKIGSEIMQRTMATA